MNDTLHTRYRPKTFKEIIGQGAMVRSLKSAVQNRTSRAFLLHGPSGTGKTSTARVAAKEIGCEDRDILEIDAATFTGIDDMRVITSGLSYRPLGGGSKVIVVDECHMLSKQAWNSLLKSIEEPPEWCWWFLCTTELGKVPATIKTRCTAYELELVGSDEIFDLLVEVAKKEKLKVDEDIIELCAKRAQGSPRQALVNLGACAHAEAIEDARALLKAVEGSAEVITLCRALLDKKPWTSIHPMLVDLQDQNAEGVRQVVRAFMTSVILKSGKDEKRAGWPLQVLDEFSQPFYSGDGISPVVLAVGRLLLQ